MKLLDVFPQSAPEQTSLLFQTESQDLGRFVADLKGRNKSRSR